MPLLSRRRLILAKIESTYGTSSSPAGTDAVLVRDLNITPLQADMVDRQLLRPFMGASPQLMANKRVQIQCTVELAGSGAAGTAPKYGPLLRACGLGETIVASTSVTYAPISSAFESVTLAYHNDGMRHLITGCRGTFTLAGRVGVIPTIQFTMTGLYAAPTDVSLPSATYSNQAQPLIFTHTSTASFSAFSYSGCMQEFNLNLGNSIVYRELVGCTKEVLITDRKTEGNVLIEAVTVATKNYYTNATGEATGAITFAHGTAAGNILTLNVPYADLTMPEDSDSDGIRMLNLPFVATPSSGNDELSLAFT
jgi:hypothetical protein